MVVRPSDGAVLAVSAATLRRPARARASATCSPPSRRCARSPRAFPGTGAPRRAAPRSRRSSIAARRRGARRMVGRGAPLAPAGRRPPRGADVAVNLHGRGPAEPPRCCSPPRPRRLIAFATRVRRPGGPLGRRRARGRRWCRLLDGARHPRRPRPTSTSPAPAAGARRAPGATVVHPGAASAGAPLAGRALVAAVARASARGPAGGRHRRRRGRGRARGGSPRAAGLPADAACWPAAPTCASSPRSSPAPAASCAATPASRTSPPRSARRRSSCSARPRRRAGARRRPAAATASLWAGRAATRTAPRPTRACSRSSERRAAGARAVGLRPDGRYSRPIPAHLG